MRLSYFFSKKECILAILEGLIFKTLRPVGPKHGGASLVTEPQPHQSQKCGYGPVHENQGFPYMCSSKTISRQGGPHTPF